MDADLARMREEYQLGGLDESDLADDPITMFDRWFEDARRGGVHEPNAMVLSTVSGGRPSARAVLLKGYDAIGFRFYTNHDSRKAHELTADPACALVFGWFELQRQVRIEGSAARLSRADDEAYFATRPRASQLGAWASAQSSVVSGRGELEAAYVEAERRFEGVDVPCPPYWGGYVVSPHTVEFWQGRRGRMHDRLVYRRSTVQEADQWLVQRLAP
ncbi:pyridoxamine 5'-phosphate oxidase [Nocardioides terrisoli]|uniref:pyridoxamine 5'-phosphate oxidase n=1 Tax=Nocardioides terrisoli TaxID=3388267 RepID=UPI00287B6A4B|nr:pyridoxamine 5'-phosphate oxidase [Nocardioides marmorisolisilvae]